MTKYYYLDISLVFADADYEISPQYFKNNIVRSVNQLFGETTSCVEIDLLKYNSSTKRGIIRVPAEYYVKIRSSLSLCAQYSEDLCAYRINKAAPLLLALQGDSRTYTH